MKKLLLIVPIILFSILGLNSCKKNSVEEQYTETVPPVVPDLSSQIQASVSGFVTDEYGEPVVAADVKAGTITTTTDAFGYFKIGTTSFAKSAGFVVVTKAGYFNGIKTFVPVTAKESFIRLELIPKIITGNCNSSTGGTITTTEGASITIPANALVVAASNAPYSGTVNAAIHWLDPSNNGAMQLTMPGDLRGIDLQGNLKTLTSFGMLAIELTGNAGELLQLAPGNTASLRFPIPSTLQSAAPATIPLWNFNESNALWKEDGHADKSGNMYEGNVSHFSYWNCDIASQSVVNFSAQVLDPALHPLLNASVSISIDGVPNSTRTDYTDANGMVNGMIPSNSNLVIDIGAVCNMSAYTQNLTTTTTDVDLGSIQVNAQSFSAVFTGTVINCSSQPVTNGYVIISGGGVCNAIEIQNGTFNSSAIVCPNASGYVVAIDRDAAQQSSLQTTTIQTGLNDFGTITACSAPTVENIIYTLDGVTTTLSLPQQEFSGLYFSANDSTSINAIDQLSFNTSFDMGFPASTSPGTYQLLGNITLDQLLYILQGPETVTITNYGIVGEFIIGHAGPFNVLDMGGNPHLFSCTFTVIRDN